MQRLDPFDPRRLAELMLANKFGGIVPSQVTAEECLDLMTEFASGESARADLISAAFENFVNTQPCPPVIIRIGEDA